MALYSIQGPDGSTYRIEGPEGATKEQVVRAIQRRLKDVIIPYQKEKQRETSLELARILSRKDEGFFDNISKGFVSGAVGVGESAALGAAALLEEEDELAVRDKIKSVANALRPEGGDQESISYKLASGLGSIAGFAAPGVAAAMAAPTALVGAAALTTVGALGAGANAGEASERARAYGATEEERSAATRRGALIGLTEIIPLRRLTKLFEIPGVSKLLDKMGGEDEAMGLINRLRSATRTGVEEGIQEAGAAILQNLNERGYNPTKELLDAGVVEEGAIGAGSGAILQGLVDFFVKGKTAKPSSEEDETTQAERDKAADKAAQAELDKRAEEGALTAAERGDEVAFEDAAAAMAQPDLFPQELQAMIDADPSGALRAQLEQQERLSPNNKYLSNFTQEEINQAANNLLALGMQPELLTEKRIANEITRINPEAGKAKLRDTQTRDMIEESEEAFLMDLMELDDAEVPRIDEQEAAEAEALINQYSLEEQQKAQREVSELESLENRRIDEREKETGAKRYEILQNTIEQLSGKLIKEKSPARQLTKAFESALSKAGLGVTTATAEERQTINRAVDVQLAEEAPKQESKPEFIESKPDDTQNEVMEAAIPERKPRQYTPGQLSFPGLGRRKPKTPPPTEEQPSAPKIVTEEYLNELGVSPKAPIRKKIGKDISEVRDELARLANNSKVSQQTRFNIARDLNETPAEQLDFFAPKPREKKGEPSGQQTISAEQRTSGASVPSPAQLMDVGEDLPSPIGTTGAPAGTGGQRLGDSGRGVGETDGGAKPKRGPLASKQPVQFNIEESIARKRAASEQTQANVANMQERIDRYKGPSATEKEPVTETPAKKEAAPKKAPAKKAAPKKAPAKKEAAPKKASAKQKPLTDKVFEALAKLHEFVGFKVTKEFSKSVPEPIVTLEDGYKILTLLQKGAKTKDKLGNAAIAYFSKHKRPIDGLYLAVFDVANNTPVFRRTPETSDEVAAYYKGMGKASGARVLEWARQNLSEQTNKWIEERLQTELVGATRFESYLNTDHVKVARARAQAITKADQLVASQFAREDKAEAEQIKEELILDELSRVLEQELETGAVSGLDAQLHPGVRGTLREGNLVGALRLLAGTSASKRIRQIAAKLANVASGTKVEIVDNLKAENGKSVAGLFDPKTNTIKLDSNVGMNPHVVLHEVTHAATSAVLANKAHPLTRQLTKLFEEVKEYLDTAYGARNVDEFASEAFSNPEFQAKLAGINPKGNEINALERFFNAVGNFLRKLLGMQTKAPDSALNAADRIIEGILTPAPKYRNSTELAMMSTQDGVRKVLGEVGGVQRKITEIFKGEWADPAADFFAKGGELGRFLFPKFLDSQALSDVAAKINSGLGKVAKALHITLENQRGALGISDKFVRERIKTVDQWVKKVGAQGQIHLNNLIYSEEYGATIYQVDPTKSESFYKGKTDDNGNDLYEIWKAQRTDWKALGEEGQKVYLSMRDTYRDLYNKLKDVVNGRIDEALADDKDAAKRLKNEVFARLFDNNTLDVYFPLLREGYYKINFNFKESAVGSKRDAHVFQMFQSKRQRDRVVESLRKNPDVDQDSINVIDGDFKTQDFRNAPSTSFVGDVLKTLSGNSEAQAMVMRLFIDALPESSFAKSLQKRKGTPGYMKDAVYAIKTKGFDLGRQIVKLEYSAKIQNLEKQLNEIEIPKNDNEFGPMKKEIMGRMRFAIGGARFKNFERYVRAANQSAFVMTLGFNVSSAMVQLAQVPMFAYPMLAARYGYRNTAAELHKAAALVTGARGQGSNALEKISMAHGLDAYYDITENGDFVLKKDNSYSEELKKELKTIAPFVRMAWERGHLNQSFMLDAIGLQEGGRARFQKGDSLMRKLAAAADFGTGVSAAMFNQAERFNRQVTGVAAYKLALARITEENPDLSIAERQAKAAEEALYDTQEYNGGSTLETAPRIAQENIFRVASMYKTYGMRMYYTMYKAGKMLIDNAFAKDAEGKKLRSIALKQMAGIHGSALLFSGIHGIPLYGAIQLFSDLFILDDEEDDFNTVIRDYVGEGFYKGGVNQILDELGIGGDVASRVRLTGLLLQTNKFNPDPSLEETLSYYLGGPALSVTKRFGRGAEYLMNGEMRRGIENILPVGIANAYKAGPFGRYVAEKGIRNRRLDIIYDDLTTGDLAMQFIGFAPSKYIRLQEDKQLQVTKDRAISEKRSDLLKKYYIAARQYDLETLLELEREITAFNAKNLTFDISSKTLINSLKQSLKTTSDSYYGVSLSKGMRDALELEAYSAGQAMFGFDRTPWLR
jgi:hypothetical protein